MFRILFLFLAVMFSVSIAQAQDKQEAYKVFEFEKISSQLLKEKIKMLCAESDKTRWIGWIINYGTPDEITERETQLGDSYSEVSRDCHDSRIIFLRGGNKGKSRTEFWIVPPGKEPPIN
jgi:hypothetical protein